MHMSVRTDVLAVPSVDGGCASLFVRLILFDCRSLGALPQTQGICDVPLCDGVQKIWPSLCLPSCVMWQLLLTVQSV